ncbi:hypothetical protein VTI28DRAFT_2688 [Corynascus sepedonium]
MALTLLSGSRRGRFLGVAIIFTLLVVWFGYQTPLSSIPHDAFDLHKDPQYPDGVPVVAKPPYGDFQGQSTSEHDHSAEGSGKDEGTVAPPLTSTNEEADEGSSESGHADGTTSAGTGVSEGEGEKTEEPGKTGETGETTGSTTKEGTDAAPEPPVECIGFEQLQRKKPGPLSEGKRQFPYVRPPPECRKFRLPALEALIERMKKVIRDPDLFRLFENSYPNTLDTMIKWRGYATKKDETTGATVETDEELTYVITGDIDAMWLRDSASQVYSYLPLLEASDDKDSLASLWRGLINSHSRYIIISPYCHSFQPPVESGIKPTHNSAYEHNNPQPPYDRNLVFDCKWELDSLASFLQISKAYHRRTGDLEFFAKYSWVDAVEAAVNASAAMRLGTYDEDGRVLPSAWTFTGWTNRGSETLTNDGLGNPVKENGMVRSAFRPSDDACIFQLLTPSNMMWAAYLEQASEIMQGLADAGLNAKAAKLTSAMRELAKGIRRGIALDAVVSHRDFGDIFAYEVDGYGGANLMDDANIPSLLAMPLWNYTTTLSAKSDSEKHAAGQSDTTSLAAETEEEDWRDLPPPSEPEEEKKKRRRSVRRRDETADGEPEHGDDEKNKKKEEEEDEEEEKQHDYAQVYQNTRRFVLSMANPYFAKGPVLSAVGGPHIGPGRGWPMAATVAALTAFEDLAGFESSRERDAVVAEQLRAVLDSTAGTGVVHESVNAWNEHQWTRSWFGWANGLFGELIIRIADDEEARGVLGDEEGLLGRLWQD